jgi:mannose-6-phosphate isomerase-like protein (cupin superfamily)
MKGMDNMYSTYNLYPYSYYTGAAIYNPEDMYNFYRACPYPYYSYDSRFNSPQSANNDGLIPLKDYGPKPYVVNINEATKQNDTFRTALWTGTHLQLTLMSINVGEDIGLEMHSDVDQFLRVEEGEGLVRMGNSESNLNFQRRIYDDSAILIPAGTWHNLINTGSTPLKLYSIYAPPNHPRGTAHETKADVEAAEESHGD